MRSRPDPTKPLTEAQWQTVVLRYARQFGWMSYHTLNSWGSAKGFPDLVLARPPRLLVAELKSDKGKVKPEQEQWLDAIRACGVEAYLWRPADVEDVVQVLFEHRTSQGATP
jgi:hypothetical protein